ncbi:Tyrosine recombinase XerD [subsurface metagenome]
MERKALKSLFGYLVDAGLWDYDPTMKLKSVPIRQKEREVPSKEDIQKLLQTPHHRKADDAKFKLIVVLLVDCGLRITEALSIKRANIDLNHLEIKGMGKGSKERIIPISPLTAQLLGAYISQDGTSE